MPRPLVTEGVDFYRFRESHQTKRRKSFGKIVEICDQTVEISPNNVAQLPSRCRLYLLAIAHTEQKLRETRPS